MIGELTVSVSVHVNPNALKTSSPASRVTPSGDQLELNNSFQQGTRVRTRPPEHHHTVTHQPGLLPKLQDFHRNPHGKGLKGYPAWNDGVTECRGTTPGVPGSVVTQ